MRRRRKGKIVSLAGTTISRQPEVTTPADLPRIGRRWRQDIAIVELDDPNPAFKGKKQNTALNLNHDVLEKEHKCGRLTDVEYQAGLILQKVMERLAENPTGGGQWSEGDRVDVVLSADHKMVRLIDNARKAVGLIGDIKPVVGWFALNILDRALRRRESFEDITRAVYGGRRPDRYRIFFVAETFRRACRALSRHWGATGQRKRNDSVEISGDLRRATVMR